MVLGEPGKPQGRKIAGSAGRSTVRVGALVAGWRRMFKVVKEMTEVPRTFPFAFTWGRVQGRGFRGWIFAMPHPAR